MKFPDTTAMLASNITLECFALGKYVFIFAQCTDTVIMIIIIIIIIIQMINELHEIHAAFP